MPQLATWQVVIDKVMSVAHVGTHSYQSQLAMWRVMAQNCVPSIILLQVNIGFGGSGFNHLKHSHHYYKKKTFTSFPISVLFLNLKFFPTTKVIHKIEKCGVELKKWSLKHFGNVRKEIESKKKQLVQAEKEALRIGDNKRVRELLNALNDLNEKEARMWLQRSKVLWAKMGDKNSRYFHLRATQRFRKNSITSLRKADGLWCNG